MKLKFIVNFLFVMVLFAIGTDVSLAGDLTTVATNLTGTATQGIKLVYGAGIMIGVGLAIGGIMGMVNAKKSQQPMGGAIIMLLGGMALASLSALLDTGGMSLTGSNHEGSSAVSGF